MKNIVPAMIIVIMVTVIVAALMILPGAAAVFHDILTVLRWVGNLLLTISILVLFFVGPWIIPVFAYFGVKELLQQLVASDYWHYAFLPVTAVLMLIVWPFLVNWIVMIPADWTSRLFHYVSYIHSGYMTYETPPLAWGIYALIATLVGYYSAGRSDR